MANLEFHPFQDGFSIDPNKEQSGSNTFSGSIGDRPRDSLVDDSEILNTGKKSIFSFSFFQQYFDVETDQVVKRLMNSVIPTGNNFILDIVQPAPDLWGPLWISITLIFSIGIFGNIAQYIENDGTPGEYGSDFRLVTTAASLIFTYVIFMPLIVFAVLWQRKSDVIFLYADLLCAFGYSLAVFIPVSLLWVFNINWLRWVLIFAAVSLSGGVLAKAIYPAFKNDSNRIVAFGSVFTILFVHFLLAFAFKEFFFDAVHPIKSLPSSEVSNASNGGGVPNQVKMNEEPTLPSTINQPNISPVTTNVYNVTVMEPEKVSNATVETTEVSGVASNDTTIIDNATNTTDLGNTTDSGGPTQKSNSL